MTSQQQDFSIALNQRIRNYFEENNISKYANSQMIFKTILGSILLVSTYLLVIFYSFSSLSVVLLYVLHAVAQIFVCFNIAHDACHGAYSNNPRVNKYLSWIFDLVGASSYMWRVMHNNSHHAYVNVPGKDTNLMTPKLFRFSPYEHWQPIHRFQHIYMPILYCFASLDWVIFKDFIWFFQKDIGSSKNLKHPLREFVFIFATKAFYFFYMIILPILYLNVPWYAVVIGFIVMHFINGFTISLIFQPTHITEETSFHSPDEEGCISEKYAQHVVESTADFAAQKKFTTWFLGSLNLHVLHHIRPDICHVHYPALTKIVKATAGEFGIVYRENETIGGAFATHLRYLKELGRDPYAGKQTTIQQSI